MPPKSETFTAYLLHRATNPVTNWPIETWVIRQENMTPVVQVQLYRYKSPGLLLSWYAWPSSICRTVLDLGLRLARIRNAVHARGPKKNPEMLTLEFIK